MGRSPSPSSMRSSLEARSERAGGFSLHKCPQSRWSTARLAGPPARHRAASCEPATRSPPAYLLHSWLYSLLHSWLNSWLNSWLHSLLQSLLHSWLDDLMKFVIPTYTC